MIHQLCCAKTLLYFPITKISSPGPWHSEVTTAQLGDGCILTWAQTGGAALPRLQHSPSPMNSSRLVYRTVTTDKSRKEEGLGQGTGERPLCLGSRKGPNRRYTLVPGCVELPTLISTGPLLWLGHFYEIVSPRVPDGPFPLLLLDLWTYREVLALCPHCSSLSSDLLPTCSWGIFSNSVWGGWWGRECLECVLILSVSHPDEAFEAKIQECDGLAGRRGPKWLLWVGFRDEAVTLCSPSLNLSLKPAVSSDGWFVSATFLALPVSFLLPFSHFPSCLLSSAFSPPHPAASHLFNSSFFSFIFFPLPISLLWSFSIFTLLSLRAGKLGLCFVLEGGTEVASQESAFPASKEEQFSQELRSSFSSHTLLFRADSQDTGLKAQKSLVTFLSWDRVTNCPHSWHPGLRLWPEKPICILSVTVKEPSEDTNRKTCVFAR